MSGTRTAYRLTIEGLGISFVTDPRMEQTEASGRVRVRGMLRDGLMIEERCKPEQGRIEVAGFTARIIDRQRDEIICDWLAKKPLGVTYLTADVGVLGSTVSVQSTAGISIGTMIHLGTEAMEVTGIAALDLTVLRQRWQTISQGHFQALGSVLASQVAIGRASTIQGRRAFLYRYTSTDDMQGDGTLIWRGVCSTDASLDSKGTTWSITIDSIASLLKQDLGSDLDQPTRAGGIYYPNDAPVIIGVIEYTTDVLATVSAATRDMTRRCVIAMHGRWPTETAFVTDLTAAIAQGSSTSGAGTTGVVAGTTGTVQVIVAMSAARHATSIVAQVAASGHVEIAYVPGSTPVALTADAGGFGLTQETMGPFALVYPAGSLSVVTGGGPYTLRAGNGGADGRGSAPRGIIGPGFTVPGESIFGPYVLDADATPDRLYLDADLSLVTLGVGALAIEWRDGAEPSEASYGLLGDPSTDGFVTLDIAGPPRAFWPGRDPLIQLRRDYGFGTLFDFMSTLTNDSPSVANRGAMPFITSFELSPLDNAVIAPVAATNPVLVDRRFIGAASVDLEDMLAQHWRLYGCYPTLSPDGRIRTTRLEMPAVTSERVVELGDTDILVDGSPPSWSRNRFGSVNTVTIRTGYDPIEDEHRDEWVVRDQQALAARKMPRTLDIAPQSQEGRFMTVERAVAVARPVLAMFGRPYSIVTMELREERLADIYCGTIIGIESHRIPNPVTGRRGIGDVAGLVLARRWELDRGRGSIEIMVSDDQLAGYAPTAFYDDGVAEINFISAGPPVVYDISLTTVDMAGHDIASLAQFPAGSRVETVPLDGTVGDVSAATVIGPSLTTTAPGLRLAFDVDIPTTALLWALRYRPYNDSALVAFQRRFGFFADNDSTLDDGTGIVGAQRYA